jgi:hypothetical protein
MRLFAARNTVTQCSHVCCMIPLSWYSGEGVLDSPILIPFTGVRYFSLLHSVQTGSGAHPANGYQG